MWVGFKCNGLIIFSHRGGASKVNKLWLLSSLSVGRTELARSADTNVTFNLSMKKIRKSKMSIEFVVYVLLFERW
jgi:hypothetical protein